MKLLKSSIIFDLETTSKNTNTAKIVQIGAVKIEPDGRVEEKDILVNPMMPIPPEVSKIHGITDAMVENASTFVEIANDLFHWFEKSDLISFNGELFDLPILSLEFERAGFPFPGKDVNLIDVLKIERIVNSHRLEEVYKRYTGKTIQNHHSAKFDAEATLEVLKHQMENYKHILPEEIGSLDSFCQGDKKRVDISARLYSKSGVIYWNFGKHRDEAVENTIDYAHWVLRQSTFPENTKRYVREILESIDKK